MRTETKINLLSAGMTGVCLHAWMTLTFDQVASRLGTQKNRNQLPKQLPLSPLCLSLLEPKLNNDAHSF
jgi:hypothetical protein